MITQDEFKQSLISCGFKWPENNQDTLKQKHVHLKRIIPLAKICDKSELAMFLANIYHESQGLAQISEINPRDDYDGGIRYKGRGYIQLTHKYNYAAASKDLYDDNILVDKPELVEEEESIAWDTTAWFWRTYVHDKVLHGFDATIKAINSIDTPKQIGWRRKYHDIIRGILGLPDQPHSYDYYAGK